VKGKRISIFLSESDEWQRRPLYQELLRTLARENIEYASVIRTMAGFTKAHDMKTKVVLMSVSGYQPLIVEFADSVENVERVMTRIAEMTAGKVFTAVDVEISPRTVPSRPSS
jgi:PII-like signaling protein